MLPASHAASLLAHAGRPHDFALGAFAGDELIAIGGVKRQPRRKRAHRATLWGMYVAPEARGRGVARALAAALIERAARVEGLDRLHLTVMAHNEAAVRLYLSLGFEVWGREPDAMRWQGASYDELSMTLRLPR